MIKNEAQEDMMATVRKTISLTSQQDAWIKTQIAQGGYASDSEVIRELIRKEQDRDSDDQPNELTDTEITKFMETHRTTIEKLAL